MVKTVAAEVAVCIMAMNRTVITGCRVKPTLLVKTFHTEQPEARTPSRSAIPLDTTACKSTPTHSGNLQQPSTPTSTRLPTEQVTITHYHSNPSTYLPQPKHNPPPKPPHVVQPSLTNNPTTLITNHPLPTTILISRQFARISVPHEATSNRYYTLRTTQTRYRQVSPPKPPQTPLPHHE